MSPRTSHPVPAAHHRVAEIDYPEPDWHQLDPRADGAAEKLAQTVAARGGAHQAAYAEALLPELRAIVEGARAREAAPLLVLIPRVPLDARPLVPATAYVASIIVPEEERTLEAVAEAFRQRRDFIVGRPEIRRVDLPAGPACRIQEMAAEETEEDRRNRRAGRVDRRTFMEYVSFFILAPEFPEGFVELTVTWSGPAAGPGLSQFADDLAATLRLVPAPRRTAEQAAECDKRIR